MIRTVDSLRHTPPYRRVSRDWNALLERQPRLYFAYQRHRGRSWPVADALTDVVIEARPGCGNSFAREAMQLANPGIRVASHVHSSAQVLLGISLGKPVVVIIRRPVDAIASGAARFEGVDLRTELISFARFYERLHPRADGFVVATFERVTTRFDLVVEAINARFEASFERFPHDDPSAVDRVFDTLVSYNRSLGIEDGRAAVPGQARNERAARARAMLADRRLAGLVERCEAAYEQFAALESPDSLPVLSADHQGPAGTRQMSPPLSGPS